MGIRFSARTDVGRVREGNEDNFLVDRKLQLFVVCDGMGGHLSGEVASATAVNVVRDMILADRELIEGYRQGREGISDGNVCDLLEHAIQQASYRIYERGMMNPEQRGMGTTCSLLLMLGDKAFIGHVGDSRIYLWRRGEASQVTEDHSLYNEMLRSGQLAPEETLAGRLKNAVTRAVGVYESVQVDTEVLTLEPGDRLMMCSDGLSGYFEDGDLERLISADDLERGVAGMIDHANAAGGRDNITVILLQVPHDSEGDADAAGRLVAAARHFDVVRGLSLLSPLAESEIRTVLGSMVERTLAPGETLAQEGHPAGGMVVVVGGQLVARHDGAEIGRLGPGQMCGEFALLGETAHRATLAAPDAAGATVLVLPRAAFRQLLVTDKTLGARLAWQTAQALGRRLLAAVREPGQLGALYTEAVEPVTRPMPTELVPGSVEQRARVRATQQRMTGPTQPHLAATGPSAVTTQDLDPDELEATEPSPGPPPVIAPAPVPELPTFDVPPTPARLTTGGTALDTQPDPSRLSAAVEPEQVAALPDSPEPEPEPDTMDDITGAGLVPGGDAQA